MTLLELTDGYLVRFHRGEEIVSGLLSLAREKDISGAWVQGLGALQRAEIGAYDLASKAYIKKLITEGLEIASLVGNLSRFEGEPVAHLHASLSRMDFTSVGGHVFLAETGATVEISIRTYPSSRIERTADNDIGLNLLDLPETFLPAS